MSELTAIEQLAIARAIKVSSEARNQVPPGEHRVTGTYDFDVVLKVGEDSEYTPTASIPMKTAFALFVKYSGVTGPHAMELLVRAFNDANDIGSDLSEIASLEKAEALVKESLSKLDKKTRKGQVRVKSTEVVPNLTYWRTLNSDVDG